jgi:LEA14-like dessication related protein
MRIALSILLIGSLAFFSSCEDLNSVQVTGIEDVKILSANKAEAKLNVLTKIDNPTALNLKVNQVEVDIYFGELHLGKIIDNQGFKLESGVHKAYPVPVTVNVQALLKDKKKLLSSVFSEGNKLKFVGNIQVGTFIFSRNIRVNHESSVDILDALLN